MTRIAMLWFAFDFPSDPLKNRRKKVKPRLYFSLANNDGMNIFLPIFSWTKSQNPFLVCNLWSEQNYFRNWQNCLFFIFIWIFSCMPLEDEFIAKTRNRFKITSAPFYMMFAWRLIAKTHALNLCYLCLFGKDFDFSSHFRCCCCYYFVYFAEIAAASWIFE